MDDQVVGILDITNVMLFLRSAADKCFDETVVSEIQKALNLLQHLKDELNEYYDSRL